MTTAKKTPKKTRTTPRPDAIEQIVKVTIEFDTEKKKRWLETESRHNQLVTEAEFIAQASKHSRIPVADIVHTGALMYARTMFTKSIGRPTRSLTRARIEKAYAKLVRAGVKNITPVGLAKECDPPSNSRSCEKWLKENGHVFHVKYRGKTETRGAV